MQQSACGAQREAHSPIRTTASASSNPSATLRQCRLATVRRLCAQQPARVPWVTPSRHQLPVEPMQPARRSWATPTWLARSRRGAADCPGPGPSRRFEQQVERLGLCAGRVWRPPAPIRDTRTSGALRRRVLGGGILASSPRRGTVPRQRVLSSEAPPGGGSQSRFKDRDRTVILDICRLPRKGRSRFRRRDLAPCPNLLQRGSRLSNALDRTAESCGFMPAARAPQRPLWQIWTSSFASTTDDPVVRDPQCECARSLDLYWRTQRVIREHRDMQGTLFHAGRITDGASRRTPIEAAAERVAAGEDLFAVRCGLTIDLARRGMGVALKKAGQAEGHRPRAAGHGPGPTDRDTIGRTLTLRERTDSVSPTEFRGPSHRRFRPSPAPVTRPRGTRPRVTRPPAQAVLSPQPVQPPASGAAVLVPPESSSPALQHPASGASPGRWPSAAASPLK